MKASITSCFGLGGQSLHLVLRLAGPLEIENAAGVDISRLFAGKLVKRAICIFLSAETPGFGKASDGSQEFLNVHVVLRSFDHWALLFIETVGHRSLDEDLWEGTLLPGLHEGAWNVGGRGALGRSLVAGILVDAGRGFPF